MLGDIWLVQNNDFISRMIMSATEGNVSHCALELRFNLIEALKQGVVFSSKEKYLNQRYVVVRVKGLTDKQRVMITHRAIELRGKPYDTNLIIGFWWRALFRKMGWHTFDWLGKYIKNHRLKVICSELVDYAFDVVEKTRDIFKGDFFKGAENFVTPWDILKSENVVYIKGDRSLWDEAQLHRVYKEME